MLLRLVVGIGTRIQTEDAALAQVVNGEIARDGEEPGLEAGAAVVGAATLQDAQPGLLYQVVDEIALPEQVDEVTDKTKLILLDEVVEQGDVSLTKTACDPLRIGSQGLRQCLVAFKHTRGIRGTGPKLRMDPQAEEKSHPSCARMGHPAILETREK